MKKLNFLYTSGSHDAQNLITSYILAPWKCQSKQTDGYLMNFVEIHIHLY